MEETVTLLINQFEEKIKQYKQENKRIVVSSSFQTHSIPLLHLISKIDASIPVYFLQTGFHFPETILYKNEVAQKYNLSVFDLESTISKSMQRDSSGQFYFASNPSYCCKINKVLPMEQVLGENDVWITGVRKDQSKHRDSLTEEAAGPNGSLRYHPMLHWTNKLIWNYIHEHNIPHHPLESKGYFSVGCEPCTAPSFSEDGERQGRWAGMKKTECGLHVDLIK